MSRPSLRLLRTGGPVAVTDESTAKKKMRTLQQFGRHVTRPRTFKSILRVSNSRLFRSFPGRLPARPPPPLPLYSTICDAARADVIAAAERRCRRPLRRNPESFRPFEERPDRGRIPRRTSTGRRLAHLLEHVAHLLQGDVRTCRTHRGNQHRQTVVLPSS